MSGEDHGCTLSDQVIKVTRARDAATLGPGAEGENVQSDFAWRAIDIATIAADDFENVASDEVVARVRGVHRRLERPTRRRRRRADHRLVRRRRLGTAPAARRGLHLRPIGGTAGEQRRARAVPGLRPSHPPVDADRAPAPRSIIRRRSGQRSSTAADDLGLNDPGSLGSNGWAIGTRPRRRRQGRPAARQSALPVGGRTPLRRGATHRARRVRHLRREPARPARHRHRLHRRRRVDPHRVGRQADDGYNLTLDPASPTSYLVDGVSVPMTSTRATIDILRADGTVDTETRTLWRSEYGPIIDFPGVGWTNTNVLTFRDANIDNNEFIEQYARHADRPEHRRPRRPQRRVPGRPAVQHRGDRLAGQRLVRRLGGHTRPVGRGRAALHRQAVHRPGRPVSPTTRACVLLDGSDSRLPVGRRSPAPAIRASCRSPTSRRSSAPTTCSTPTTASGCPSAEFTLTGPYSIMNGEQGTALTMRTRQNAAVLGDCQHRRAWPAPMGCSTPTEVRTAAFENTARTAALLRGAAVAACKASPLVDVPDLLADDGTVSLPAATVDLTTGLQRARRMGRRVRPRPLGADDLARDDGPVRRRRLRTRRAHSSPTRSIRPIRPRHHRCPRPIRHRCCRRWVAPCRRSPRPVSRSTRRWAPRSSPNAPRPASRSTAAPTVTA